MVALSPPLLFGPRKEGCAVTHRPGMAWSRIERWGHSCQKCPTGQPQGHTLSKGAGSLTAQQAPFHKRNQGPQMRAAQNSWPVLKNRSQPLLGTHTQCSGIPYAGSVRRLPRRTHWRTDPPSGTFHAKETRHQNKVIHHGREHGDLCMGHHGSEQDWCKPQPGFVLLEYDRDTVLLFYPSRLSCYPQEWFRSTHPQPCWAANSICRAVPFPADGTCD